MLEGIYDRNGLLHRLNYEEILGAKGEVKYDSTRIKSLPFGELTIAQSVREYAQKYVLAGNKRADEFRTNLKTLFPDLTDTVLNDLSFAENKIAEKKSKLGMMFFKAYERQVRAAYTQTIAHLKKWAEDERRVAKDYDGEVKRLRAELAALEKELKNASLVKHADDTVNSYTKIATNLFEQESLPLSRVRIYENYISTYKQIRTKLQSVNQLFVEASSKYVPSSWFLTGYPAFDKDIADRLVTLMTAERARSSERVSELLKELNQKDARCNLQNECHKRAFDIVAAQRYRIAFTQHLAEYFRSLAGESSKWADSYEAAKASYEGTRDSLLKNLAPPLAVMDNAYINAFTTFFFSMGFAIASNDTDQYRQIANGYEAQMVALREQDKSDRMAGTQSEAGKSLQQCLQVGMELSIQLSNAEPEPGTDIDAVVKLIKGTLPKETSWAWATSGGLTAKQKFGEKTVVTVASEGELTVRLMDERYTSKSLAETKVKIVPKAGPFRIQLRGPQEGEIGKSLAFGAEPTPDSVVPKDIQYEWMVDDQAAGQGSRLSRSFSQARPVGIRVDAYRMVGGKRVVLDSARQTVMIRDMPKKDDTADRQREKEQLEKEAAAREQAEKERIGPEQQTSSEKAKAPPACTYRYSEWGECSRATKRQTRSVVVIEPFGCVERGQPALEQECTPPPTAEELRLRLLGCLCSVTGGYGYAYTPDDCAKNRPGDGVCSWSGSLGGYWCYHIKPNPAEKGAECYKSVYGRAPTSQDLAGMQQVMKEANRKNAKKLTVSLSPDAKPIKAQYGTTVTLTANVAGGIPGYTYFWSGQGSAKDNTFTFINTRKPGSSTVSVTVTDSDGGSATASASILVEGIEVAIEKTSPAGATVPVGGQASFRATVKGGGEVSYLWQPHPEVEFSPFEKSATTTATFRNPGSAGIWVEVLIKDGAAMRSAGRSNVITLQVVNPQWTLEFSPANPRVGQPVKAKIAPAGAGAGVNTGEMNFRWQLPANAKQTGTSKDDSEITFVLNDTKPANIACTVATKRKNENLGGAGKTIAAQGFGVKVSGPR
ncbi:MAG: hypothetical protein GX423_03265, partial [Nitrospiraceae bacterium]|nr:hypothetical protein [Nitrospiraceae bacterium]